MIDFKLGDTLYFKFTTRSFATGAPTTLAGTPVISAYEDANPTQITAGVTLTVDYDGVTGLNHVAVVATSGNGFETLKKYDLVVTTGTVGGVSVVGEVVGSFGIEKSSAAQDLANATDGLGALRTLLLDIPTVAEFEARTLVSASYFDPATDTVATVTSVTNAVTLPAIPANWITAAGIAASALNGKGDWNIGKTGYTLTQAFPTNFADMAITLTTGKVTVGTNDDKTGYSISGTKTTLDALNDIAATAIVSAGAITTLSGAVVNVDTVDTCTTNTDMRGTDNAALATALTTAQNDLDIITDTDGVIIGAAGVDKIIDEPLTKATHNVVSSLGKRVRDLASVIIRADTAQGPGTGNNQIQLDTGSSAVDGAYDPSIVSIIDGTGAGQTRLILQYNGTTKTATVDRSWKVAPDATSEFVIVGDAGREHVNEGLAQAGTGTTITLNALASAVDDTYNGQIVFVRSGVGEDQARVISAYNGTTKVATVEKAWLTNPNSTSGYIISPLQVSTLAELADNVWDDTLAAHVIAGTFGKALNDVLEDTSDIQPIIGSGSPFASAVKGNVVGTVGVGSTTTSIVSSSITPSGTDENQFKGKIMTFTSDTTTAALRSQSTEITANTAAANPTFTVTALTTSAVAVSGDTFTLT